MDQKKEREVALRPPADKADEGTPMDPEVNLRDRSNASGEREEEDAD